MNTKATRLIVCAVWVSMLLGCSTTRVITAQHGLTLLQDAVLVTTTGARLGTRLVVTTGDSILAYDYTFDRNLHFHFSAVQKVETIDRRKAALAGLWLGAAGGAILGCFTGEQHPDDALEGRGAHAVMLGILGGSVGAIIGAVKGRTETYVFEETQEEADTSERLSESDAEPSGAKRR